MRIRSWPLLTLILTSLAQAALAQSQPANTVRTVLAAGHLASVVDTPLYFKLLALRLAPSERASYSGPSSMAYVLSGTLTVTSDGSTQTLSDGAGFFISAGHAISFTATAGAPTQWLQFILTPAELQKPLLGGSASVEELYRTPDALPGLNVGPYEFSLTRVALPASMPANPPHYRSGAALYYILAGSGTFTADGKSEPRKAGMPHFERSGLIHQWANPGEAPLVLLQANISQEGVPAVLSAAQN